MQTIGVRELKAQLSEYLRRVQAGERLAVTDRGRPVAVIVPVQPRPSQDWAHALVARGRARWAGGKPSGLQARINPRGVRASRMVIEDRR
jgi:prevent-host-death family protein